MTTFWVATYAYLSYTLAILLAIVAGLGAMLQQQLYQRVGDGRPSTCVSSRSSEVC